MATGNCGEGDWFFGMTDDSGFHFTVMTTLSSDVDIKVAVGGYVDDATGLLPGTTSGRAAFVMYEREASDTYPRIYLYQLITLTGNSVQVEDIRAL